MSRPGVHCYGTASREEISQETGQTEGSPQKSPQSGFSRGCQGVRKARKSMKIIGSSGRTRKHLATYFQQHAEQRMTPKRHNKPPKTDNRSAFRAREHGRAQTERSFLRTARSCTPFALYSRGCRRDHPTCRIPARTEKGSTYASYLIVYLKRMDRLTM
jgi:hypothetical protein